MHKVPGLLLVAFVALMMAISTPASSQQSAVVVGVVDTDKVDRESKAGKSIRAQLEKLKKKFEDEVTAQLKSFREQEKKLVDQRSSLSAEEFEKKKNELNKKGNEIEKALAEKQRKLEVDAAKARAKIYETMAVIVQDIAKERGMTLVVTRASALVYDANYEITAEVLKKLDAKLPSLKVQ
jgi:Skp family chaperone for outer membrane proteins